MLRLMIVDDEYIVRQGLKKSLPWDTLDVQWVGDADCVSGAIETARDVLPDIVLCDIRMPGGSGLSVIEEVRKMVPWVQFIMLTAYSDRDLMREAIQLGVCDYLFKPADRRDIQAAIQRAKERVIADRQKREKDREYRSFLFEHADSLRESLIQQILCGNGDEEKLKRDAQKLQIDLRGPQYCVAEIRASAEIWQQFISQANIRLERYHVSAAKLGSRKDRYALLMNCSPEDSTASLYEALNARLSWDVRLSERCESLRELPVVYQLLAEAPMSANDTPERKSDPELLLRREYILEAVKYHDSVEEIQRLFLSFWKYGQSLSLDREELKLECRSIAGTIRIMCGLPGKGTQQWDEPSRAIAALCRELRESSGYQVNDVAGKVTYLLKKRCTEDLSREQIAAELFVSASYLSRILKERTGHGFTYWLNFYRIQAAKKLLEDPAITVEQVSAMVGYNSYRIFSGNFRKYTQETATTWRKKH